MWNNVLSIMNNMVRNVTLLATSNDKEEIWWECRPFLLWECRPVVGLCGWAMCSYDLCAWAPSELMQNWWNNMDCTPSVARCGLHSIVFWCVRGMERNKCKDLQAAQRDPKPPNPTKDQRWGQSLGNGRGKHLATLLHRFFTSSH